MHVVCPGVAAWANWRAFMPEVYLLGCVIAPDMWGCGFTDRPQGIRYGLDTWVEHLVGILDAMELDRVDFVGNSFGGGLSLAFAIRFPHRVRRLVLMGSAGVSFKLTDGLDAVWGYEDRKSTRLNSSN